MHKGSEKLQSGVRSLRLGIELVFASAVTVVYWLLSAKSTNALIRLATPLLVGGVAQW